MLHMCNNACPPQPAVLYVFQTCVCVCVWALFQTSLPVTCPTSLCPQLYMYIMHTVFLPACIIPANHDYCLPVAAYMGFSWARFMPLLLPFSPTMPPARPSCLYLHTPASPFCVFVFVPCAASVCLGMHILPAKCCFLDMPAMWCALRCICLQHMACCFAPPGLPPHGRTGF